MQPVPWYGVVRYRGEYKYTEHSIFALPLGRISLFLALNFRNFNAKIVRGYRKQGKRGLIRRGYTWLEPRSRLTPFLRTYALASSVNLICTDVQ
jgi:hypothetical protein